MNDFNEAVLFPFIGAVFLGILIGVAISNGYWLSKCVEWGKCAIVEKAAETETIILE